MSNKPLAVTSWYNNKRVTVISNFVGKNNVDQCTHFDREECTNIKVQHAATVRIYNSFMGGVNKADMLLALYHTKYDQENGTIIFFSILSVKFLSSTAISLCNSTSNVVPEEFLPPSTKRVKVSYIPESAL